MRVIICNGENKGIDHNSDTTKESHGARQLGMCASYRNSSLTEQCYIWCDLNITKQDTLANSTWREISFQP